MDVSIDDIRQGVELLLPEEELEKRISERKVLKVKFGMDPTAPDLHLGHAIVLEKLRQFQVMGHEVIVIIGDFTARIGDPSQKSKTRPKLSVEQIAENAKTYFEQVGRILDVDKLKVVYNAEWLSKISLEEYPFLSS